MPVDRDAIGDAPRTRTRQDQPGVEPGKQGDGADEIDDQGEDALDDVDDAVAERRAALQHLLGDAAGKIVLEEGEALAKHVAVAPPADQRRQARHEGDAGEAPRQERGDRPDHQDDESPCRPAPSRSARRTRPAGLSVAQSTMMPRKTSSAISARAANRDTMTIADEQAAHRREEIAVERQHPLRRADHRRIHEGIAETCEPVEHRHLSSAGRSAGRNRCPRPDI